MFTNIKYITVFFTVCIISIPVWGKPVNVDSLIFTIKDELPIRDKKFQSLFWLHVSGATDQDNVEDFEGYQGLILTDISVAGILKNEKETSRFTNLIIGGSSNSIKETIRLPSKETIALLKDSKLLDDYNNEVRNRLNILHFTLDPEAGFSEGLKFEWLFISDTPSKLLSKIENGNSYIIDGDRNLWINRINELIKSGKIPKKLINHKIKEANEITDKIISNENTFIPISDSKIDNPVYAKNLLNNPIQVSLIRKIYESTFQIRAGRDIPIGKLQNQNHAVLSDTANPEFLQGIGNYGNVTFFDFQYLNHRKIDQLKLFDRVFVHLVNEVTPDQLSILQMLQPNVDLFISYLGREINIDTFRDYPNFVWHPENNVYTQQIGPQIFFGGINRGAPSIRLAFGDPEDVGIHSQTLTKIDSLVQQSIQDSIFPGAQVLVARKGKIVYNKQFGYLTYQKQIPVKYNTVYDLASVTKVLATIPALMVLDSLSKIDLDAKISWYLPEIRGSNKENMTIRDILTHQAGLYPYWPFWKNTVTEYGMDPFYYQANPNPLNQIDQPFVPGIFRNEILPDSIWKWTIDLKLSDRFDSFTSYNYVYSDLGFLMLKKLVEKYLLQPIDSFALEKYYSPLGMNNTSFLPDCKFPLEKIAPTELDSTFRKMLIHGTVHDQTAAMLGGVAGHAGLFSNAMDLAKFMYMYMNGSYGGKQYFPEELITSYTSRQYSDNRRGLGWDKKDNDEGGNTSYFASPRAFGHTGFSGTSVWADPEFDLIYVFLSNRIHPDAENFKIVEFSIRTRIQDIIYEAIWEHESVYGCY